MVMFGCFMNIWNSNLNMDMDMDIWHLDMDIWDIFISTVWNIL